jgi:hypothetical protein
MIIACSSLCSKSYPRTVTLRVTGGGSAHCACPSFLLPRGKSSPCSSHRRELSVSELSLRAVRRRGESRWWWRRPRAGRTVRGGGILMRVVTADPPNQVRVWGNSSERTQTSFSGGQGQQLARWLLATQWGGGGAASTVGGRWAGLVGAARGWSRKTMQRRKTLGGRRDRRR